MKSTRQYRKFFDNGEMGKILNRKLLQFNKEL